MQSESEKRLDNQTSNQALAHINEQILNINKKIMLKTEQR